MITTYTMSNIKSYIDGLKWKSVDEYRNKMETDFELYLEDHAEIMLDISKYEAACQMARNLEKQYHPNWCHDYSRDLKSIVKSKYFDERQTEVKKIKEQFGTIQDKLKTMRNPDKALEFLGLCGIELPKQIKPPTPDIPVDPEFIKSVLPAAKQLTTTKQEETQNE